MRITLGQLREIIREEVSRIRVREAHRPDDMVGADMDDVAMDDPGFWQGVSDDIRGQNAAAAAAARRNVAAGLGSAPDPDYARIGRGKPSGGADFWRGRSAAIRDENDADADAARRNVADGRGRAPDPDYARIGRGEPSPKWLESNRSKQINHF